MAFTGCGANTITEGPIDTCNTYETVKGQAASTTGNITGVYDTSGGAWDMTLTGTKEESNKNYIIGKTGFTQEELTNLYQNGKYLEIYSLGKPDNKLGDAMIEMGPITTESTIYFNSWYHSYYNFPTETSPIIVRGGYWEKPQYSEVMASGQSSGFGYGIGSRIVIL